MPGARSGGPTISAHTSIYSDHGGLAIGTYHQHRGEVAVRPVRLAPRPSYLAGREGLLAEIRGRLTAARTPGLVALHGLGGVGKTSVAVEYGHRHLGEYGLVWQLAAEDPATLSAGIVELALLLGVRDLVDGGDPVGQMHAALAARPDRWLLLLDNAPNPSVIRSVVPPAGVGHVLVTTRWAHWPTGQGQDVPVLDEQVGAGFLIERTGEEDATSAGLLALELGGLPLALEQAAAYIRETGGTLAGYRRLLEVERGALLGRGHPWGYDKLVATTWVLAFEQLQRNDPAAVGLLRLVACYAPEVIPLDLLLGRLDQPLTLGGAEEDPEVGSLVGALLASPLAVGDAVAALRRYSLISALGGGAVSMHRLVQAVTLDQLTGDQRRAWQRAAAVLLASALPDDPRQRENWSVFARLVAHAHVALPPDHPRMTAMVNYLDASGDYSTAKTLQQQFYVATLDKLGAEHPDTLTARASLVHWTGAAGDAKAARDLFTELLPVREQVSGPEHPDTLTVRGYLAYWTGRAGDVKAARDLYMELLPVREQVSGPEHPDTLTVRGYLAHWTGRAGDARAARDLYMDLLPMQERVSGPEHPDTLTVRANVARWTGRAGNVIAARDLYIDLLPAQERASGSDHPNTLTDRGNHARYTGLAGDATAARDLYTELLPVREQVSGPEHPDTLADRANLAYWTGQAGEMEAARDLYVELLPVRERVSGPEHPETLIIRANLARVTGETGDVVGARDQCAALLPIRERVLGAEHPGTLALRANLAHWTGQAGDVVGARDQCAALLPIRERVSGAEHPATLALRANLAHWTG